jgi:type II secretory pathway predicted ATPase ExeA
MSNPFYPSYGILPKVFLGRESIIRDFMYGLDNGPGDPNRSTAITGARGTGKTVILKEIESEALDRGWISVYTIMRNDLPEDLYEEARRKCTEHIKPDTKRKATGVSLWQFNISWENIDSQNRWESRMFKLLSELTEKDIGVVFEIDEIRGNSEGLRKFAAFFQQYRDRFKIALIMAGVPHQLDSVFSDRVISFLRRSRQKQVGLLNPSESKSLIRQTFELSSKSITDEAIDLIVLKSGGFPYLIQLLGYEVWENSNSKIDTAQTKDGISKAETYIGSSLIELILQDLSLADKDFVYGLANIETPAQIKDLMNQTGFDRNKLNQYRRRLDREGIVHSPQRGHIDFVIPYMKDYIKQEISES